MKRFMHVGSYPNKADNQIPNYIFFCMLRDKLRA